MESICIKNDNHYHITSIQCPGMGVPNAGIGHGRGVVCQITGGAALLTFRKYR